MTQMSDPNFAPSPAQLALMTHLQATLERRQQEIAEVASNASSTRQSPDGEASSQGLVRTRDEMELQSFDDTSFPVQPGFMTGPYTVEEARAFKRTKNLSAQSDADAEAFMNAKYQVSDTLGRTLHDWSYAAILSATITSYRDQEGVPSIATNIMNVMRTCQIAELPPSKETGRCEAVKAIIISGLTQVRCHIKACVFKALKEHAPGGSTDDKSVVDIATLTRSCIGNAPAKPTARLYQRVAFIRLCARECKATSTSEAKFWKEVDSKLATYRKVAVTKEALQILYNANYEDDKKLYGPPDAAIPTATMHDMEDWLATLQEAICLGAAQSAHTSWTIFPHRHSPSRPDSLRATLRAGKLLTTLTTHCISLYTNHEAFQPESVGLPQIDTEGLPACMHRPFVEGTRVHPTLQVAGPERFTSLTTHGSWNVSSMFVVPFPLTPRCTLRSPRVLHTAYIGTSMKPACTVVVQDSAAGTGTLTMMRADGALDDACIDAGGAGARVLTLSFKGHGAEHTSKSGKSLGGAQQRLHGTRPKSCGCRCLRIDVAPLITFLIRPLYATVHARWIGALAETIPRAGEVPQPARLCVLFWIVVFRSQ
ncbi:hypothetical protein FB451DRAFT_1511725 [Mycena latifolia]|nr:hypothetical protein FB451DRAFT_1511725 [Mycena latifolia]